jgi:hypothetical protein
MSEWNSETNILVTTPNDLKKGFDPNRLTFAAFDVETIDRIQQADLVLFEFDGRTYILKNRLSSINWPGFVKEQTVASLNNPGYHTIDIPKGELGEFSKIKEECLELEDALNQGSEVMALVELADLYGAIESYLEKHHKLTVGDLKKFSDITKRAFINGRRS